MRNGDFTVEVVPRGRGVGVRELDSGHVLARPGQVYALRLRNHGPLRCVADVKIDGREVTAGGLVIDAGCTEELERPITPDEDGCFTVIAEGDERVFGPDGGRDNEDLGLIEVRFRRELPGGDRPRPLPQPNLDGLELDGEFGRPRIGGRPMPGVSINMDLDTDDGILPRNGTVLSRRKDRFTSALFAEPAAPYIEPPQLEDIERAAGTGLTGHSTQRFRATRVGQLESEATVLRLRLVIATDEAILATPESRGDQAAAPARPLARP